MLRQKFSRSQLEARLGAQGFKGFGEVGDAFAQPLLHGSAPQFRRQPVRPLPGEGVDESADRFVRHHQLGEKPLVQDQVKKRPVNPVANDPLHVLAERRILLEQGHRLRVYVPYGVDWYAYSTRRLRENPEVARNVVRAFFSRS